MAPAIDGARIGVRADDCCIHDPRAAPLRLTSHALRLAMLASLPTPNHIGSTAKCPRSDQQRPHQYSPNNANRPVVSPILRTARSSHEATGTAVPPSRERRDRRRTALSPRAAEDELGGIGRGGTRSVHERKPRMDPITEDRGGSSACARRSGGIWACRESRRIRPLRSSSRRERNPRRMRNVEGTIPPGPRRGRPPPAPRR